MSNKNYDLDSGVEEGFNFVLGGNTYFMRYPTTEEVEEMQKEKNPQKQAERMFEFAVPVDQDAPSLKEALKSKNVKVLKKFSEMIAVEFGGE